MDWDVFISHAWEDKEAFARPLARALEAQGLRVWFDEFTLTVGDSLRRSIDRGLAGSRYGVVILSPHFFAKEWPQKELDGLVSRESDGEKVILPIWHDITRAQVERYSPLLAGRLAALSSRGVDQVVVELLRAIHRDSRPQTAPPSPELPSLLTIESPIHLELVLVPAGKFLMGSDPKLDKDAYDNEQPQHRLFLPEFHIGKYPVTNAQYAIFVNATRRNVPRHWEESDLPADIAEHPVVNVAWQDAADFCRWLSEATRRSFRLPSEAEWEKAARGADGRIYPWGSQAPDEEKAAWGTDGRIYPWRSQAPDEKRCNFGGKIVDTTPASKYPNGASPCGALDMAGNVWEWTGSILKPYPYKPDDGREEPGDGTARVVRGGAFNDSARYVRCAYRKFSDPNYGLRHFGFRVVAPLSVGISGL